MLRSEAQLQTNFDKSERENSYGRSDCSNAMHWPRRLQSRHNWLHLATRTNVIEGCYYHAPLILGSSTTFFLCLPISNKMPAPRNSAAREPSVVEQLDQQARKKAVNQGLNIDVYFRSADLLIQQVRRVVLFCLLPVSLVGQQLNQWSRRLDTRIAFRTFFDYVERPKLMSYENTTLSVLLGVHRLTPTVRNGTKSSSM